MKMTKKCFESLQEELRQIDLTLAYRQEDTYDKDNIEDMGFPYNQALQDSDNRLASLYNRRKEIIAFTQGAEIVESLVDSETAADVHDTVLVDVCYESEEPMEEAFYLKEMLEESDIHVNDDVMAISVSSPIGKALLGSEIGQTLTVKTPAGTATIQVIDIQKSRGR